MGVEYTHCESCGDTLYEEYVGECTKCHASLCTVCLVNCDDMSSRYAHEYGYHFDSTKPELMGKYEREGFELYDKDKKPYYEEDGLLDDSSISSEYCPYCSGNDIDKNKLYEFIVEKYKIDIDKEWNELKNK